MANKEYSDWWKQLYQIHKDECEEMKQEPMEEVEFNDELQNHVRELTREGHLE